MANIENLKAFDPFADAAKGDDESVQDGLVHVRIQLDPKPKPRVMLANLGKQLVRRKREAWDAVALLRLRQRRLVRLLERDQPTHEVVDVDHGHSDVGVDGAYVCIAGRQAERRLLVRR